MADRNITSISLNDVRKLIDEKNIGETVAETVSNLLGLVLALSPLYAGPGAAVFLSLIEPKNELIDVFKSAVKKISKSKPDDYLDRAERMAAANCMLTYVALFDAFRRMWPEIVQRLEISQEQAREMLRNGLGHMVAGLPAAVDEGIAIPHPAAREGHGSARDVRHALYLGLTDRIVECLGTELPSIVPEGPEALYQAKYLGITKLLSTLPEHAEALYQAEYLGMAAEFEQFFIWSVLRSEAGFADRIEELAADERFRFELVGRAMHSVDLGLRDLAEAVARLPYATGRESGAQADYFQAIAAELNHKHAEGLQRQVIDDQFTVEGEPVLSFPRKIHAYVPQAFRSVLFRERGVNLGREDYWREREVRDGVGVFIMTCLESPYSVQAPLLILGHPGSGKSLLTEVLAGQLAYPAYTTVRVKLRDADPDDEFVTLLEKQVHADTGRRVSWADFAASLTMAPPVVILDGYDELLQATGQVFASYLEKVRQFQHDQAVLRRPVRVIVTSRVTLIDKAQIPLGTTVVRLEEFDERRCATWAAEWNRCNAAYFARTGIQPFAVPKAERLVKLAGQPLLLLMLAIYDSAANELSTRPEIDQTLLYDRLLRRFIERELAKGEAGREFQALPQGERHAAIDWEMDRLGVAAIGMLNRHDVKISRGQLNGDLRYFGKERTGQAEGRRLQQADLVLGSFFFVHESRTRLSDESATGAVAFEFLHNTFGEFLAADFIVRRAITEARRICALAADPSMADMRPQRLAMLSEDWVACLVHTPLHTRPVILSMIEEWTRHQVDDGRWLRADVLAALDAILVAQVRLVLNDVAVPDPSPERRALSPYDALPRRGQAAVYSLNLVLLRACIGGEQYVIEEGALGSPGSGCAPWDALTGLWRSWFTLEELRPLGDLLTVTRRGPQVEVALIRPYFTYLGSVTVGPDDTRLAASFQVAEALGDAATLAVTGLHLITLYRQPPAVYRDLARRIVAEFPDLKPLVDLLMLKMGVADGDDLPADLLPLPFHESAGTYNADFADAAARLIHSPRQWDQVDAGLTAVLSLSRVSRYEAEATLESRSLLEPILLPVLLDNSVPRRHSPGQTAKEAWREFLRSSAAAPVLREAARKLEPAQYSLVATEVARLLGGEDTQISDVDTAAALAIFAGRGGAHGLCVQMLDLVVRECEGRKWNVLDIPVETWEEIAGLLHLKALRIDAGRRKKLATLADDAVAASVPMRGIRTAVMPAQVRFLASALRIGATRNQVGILNTFNRVFGQHPGLYAGMQRECGLKLLGWLRESGNEALLRELTPPDRQFGSWLAWFLGRALRDCPPEAADELALERNLTHREAMDLRWALSVLHVGKSKPQRP